MKKVFLFATAALMVTGMAFANNGDGKKKKEKEKKCAKAKSCCSKKADEKKGSCHDKSEKNS